MLLWKVNLREVKKIDRMYLPVGLFLGFVLVRRVYAAIHTCVFTLYTLYQGIN